MNDKGNLGRVVWFPEVDYAALQTMASAQGVSVPVMVMQMAAFLRDKVKQKTYSKFIAALRGLQGIWVKEETFDRFIEIAKKILPPDDFKRMTEEDFLLFCVEKVARVIESSALGGALKGQGEELLLRAETLENQVEQVKGLISRLREEKVAQEQEITRLKGELSQAREMLKKGNFLVSALETLEHQAGAFVKVYKGLQM